MRGLGFGFFLRRFGLEEAYALEEFSEEFSNWGPRTDSTDI